MAKVRGAIVVDSVKCKGCGLCVEACPSNVIQLSVELNAKGMNYATMHVPDACTGCANCAMVCPDSCITVYRKKV